MVTGIIERRCGMEYRLLSKVEHLRNVQWHSSRTFYTRLDLLKSQSTIVSFWPNDWYPEDEL